MQPVNFRQHNCHVGIDPHPPCRYVLDMNELPSLPTVSATAMLWVLHRIVFTAHEPRYTPHILREAGRPRNIGTLLRLLELVSRDGRLVDDALAKRGDPQGFRDLLLGRFRKVCRDRDWWTDQLDRDFGRSLLGEKALDELLNSLPPVRRQSKAAKRNLLAGLRELHNCLVHGLERDWVEQRLAELQSRRKAGSSRDAKGAMESGPTAPQPTPRSTHRPTGSDPPRPAADLEKFLEAKLGLTAVDTIRPELFPLEFDTNQDPSLVVQAWFNPPLETLSGNQLRRLANLLKWRAAQMTSEDERPAIAANTKRQRRRTPAKNTRG
jgi:hypothetical protein